MLPPREVILVVDYSDALRARAHAELGGSRSCRTPGHGDALGPALTGADGFRPIPILL